MPNVTGDMAAKITREVALGVPPESSPLSYTPEMMAFREKVEEEWLAHLDANPDAELHVPEDLPDADLPTPTYEDAEDDTEESAAERTDDGF